MTPAQGHVVIAILEFLVSALGPPLLDLGPQVAVENEVAFAEKHTIDRVSERQRLGLEPAAYARNWSLVRSMNGFSLDRKVRAAGWNSFFMAGPGKRKW